ncbi:MAG: site-specific DNA-methyltransferase [Planctomycetota bacterium]|nr:site-specific DNA-methyltransferase [Planctomycetota bacterium]
MAKKKRAPRNRTIVLEDGDRETLLPRLIPRPEQGKFIEAPEGVICGDHREWLPLFPEAFVDLLFLDPPYNMDKSFNGWKFSQRTVANYTEWLDGVLQALKPCLKKTATIYICGDWRSSHSIFEAASRHFVVRNRVTWEREKGRGSKRNWKNSSEDIWFCTAGDKYTFNVDAVKLRRRVIAPYKNANGKPKDWEKTDSGNFRDTHPSNLWTDISIPFWSMPENTDHPTQKSEKLLAKLILASSDQKDFILDPFLGSGSSAVVAKKLGRRYLGLELNEEYALLSLKRLHGAGVGHDIQGYSKGVFWERNTLASQRKKQGGAGKRS